MVFKTFLTFKSIFKLPLILFYSFYTSSVMSTLLLNKTWQAWITLLLNKTQQAWITLLLNKTWQAWITLLLNKTQQAWITVLLNKTGQAWITVLLNKTWQVWITILLQLYSVWRSHVHSFRWQMTNTGNAEEGKLLLTMAYCSRTLILYKRFLLLCGKWRQAIYLYIYIHTWILLNSFHYLRVPWEPVQLWKTIQMVDKFLIFSVPGKRSFSL